MEKQDLASALLKKQIQKEAWENISRKYPLTERMLMQNLSELDWKKVSRNPSIHWDVDMLERYRCSIDWEVFSGNADNEILSEVVIEKFKDKWDWSELSGNPNLPLSYELIDKYIDRWDWARLIDHCHYHYHNNRGEIKGKVLNMEFFNRYQQYIPAEALENSQLWNRLVDEEEEAIKRELILRTNR